MCELFPPLCAFTHDSLFVYVRLGECVCLCVKEEQCERGEMPAVCTICVKHMAGRRSGRLCVCE